VQSRRPQVQVERREDLRLEERHGLSVVGVAGTNFSSPKFSPGRSPQRSVAVTWVSSCSGVAVVTDVLGHCHELSPRSDGNISLLLSCVHYSQVVGT
jgi:hypothetical protein